MLYSLLWLLGILSSFRHAVLCLTQGEKRLLHKGRREVSLRPLRFLFVAINVPRSLWTAPKNFVKIFGDFPSQIPLFVRYRNMKREVSFPLSPSFFFWNWLVFGSPEEKKAEFSLPPSPGNTVVPNRPGRPDRKSSLWAQGWFCAAGRGGAPPSLPGPKYPNTYSPPAESVWLPS